jgi:hypothetical protein
MARRASWLAPSEDGLSHAARHSIDFPAALALSRRARPYLCVKRAFSQQSDSRANEPHLHRAHVGGPPAKNYAPLAESCMRLRRPLCALPGAGRAKMESFSLIIACTFVRMYIHIYTCRALDASGWCHKDLVLSCCRYFASSADGCGSVISILDLLIET